jgi:hypothetical protein
LSGIPSNLRYYPDNKAILDVGESVILFCAKPPAIPRLAECFSPDSISFSDYPDCDYKEEQFEEEKRRDEVEEYSDSKSC